VNYERIDEDGLHISFGSERRDPQVLAVDTIVICAGQEPVRDLEEGLRRNGIDPHIIGRAALAVEPRRQARSGRAPSWPPGSDR
jgi:2,4-dienoyl-CoA reductase (NADPH2)